MKNLTMVFYKIDKTYGGSDYIEITQDNNLYTIGNTRSHWGHNSKSEHIEISTKKELKRLIERYENRGYKKVDSLYNYQGKQ